MSELTAIMRATQNASMRSASLGSASVRPYAVREHVRIAVCTVLCIQGFAV